MGSEKLATTNAQEESVLPQEESAQPQEGNVLPHMRPYSPGLYKCGDLFKKLLYHCSLRTNSLPQDFQLEATTY